MQRMLTPICTLGALVALALGCGTSGGPACEELSRAACEARADCVAVTGMPAEDYFELAGGVPAAVYAGCRPAYAQCGGTKTCAIHPATGGAFVFGSTCTPAGWKVTDGSECWSEPVCPTLGQDACEAHPECRAVLGAGAPSPCGSSLPGEDELLGCMAASKSCTEKPVCAENQTTWKRFDISSGCVPEGYVLVREGPCCDPVDCPALEQADCAAYPACKPVLGMEPDATACSGAAPAEPDIFLGCVPAAQELGDGLGCLSNEASGERVLAPDAFAPGGWEGDAAWRCCADFVAECPSLAEDACVAALACTPLMGVPAADACRDEPGEPVFAGRLRASRGCQGMTGCVRNETTGERFVTPSQCKQDGYAILDMEVCCPAPAECAKLDQDSCTASDACSPILGAPAAEYCAGDLSGWMGTVAGCMEADEGCDGAETCAKDPDSGEKLVFPSTCVPPGWSTLDMEPCCAADPLPCEALDQAACAESAECTPLQGAPAADVCAGDLGGWMSVFAGCTKAGMGCGDAETCAQDPGTGEKLVFPSTCIPAGWLAVDEATCCGKCASLPPEACEAGGECTPILAMKAKDYCDAAVLSPEVVGCRSKAAACDPVVTCGKAPGSSPKMVFQDSCIPEGWETPADCCDLVPDCKEGAETGVGKLCVRGDMGDAGESLVAGAPLEVQVFPKGCFSSSCTKVHESSCTVTGPESGPIVTVEGLFCLEPTGDIMCTPDCSGGGFAGCESAGPLAEGSYTVTLGDLHVEVTIPSKLPFGGICAGSPL